MPHQLAASIVRALHLAIAAFMTTAPFWGGCAVLGAYLVLAPGLWLHWALNQDACVLTVLESWLRGVPPGRSFFHALLAPLFGWPAGLDAGVRIAVWAGSLALWVAAGVRATRACDGECDVDGGGSGGGVGWW